MTRSASGLARSFRAKPTPDPRREAGDYLIANTTPTEAIGVEGWLNVGMHAHVPECADELRKRAEAVKEGGNGTGESFLAAAELAPTLCRPILEYDTEDRFEKSRYKRRWSVPFEEVTTSANPPRFLTTSLSYEPSAKAHRSKTFESFVKQGYVLDRVFVRPHTDPRVSLLLSRSFYDFDVYVYRRKGS